MKGMKGITAKTNKLCILLNPESLIVTQIREKGFIPFIPFIPVRSPFEVTLKTSDTRTP